MFVRQLLLAALAAVWLTASAQAQEVLRLIVPYPPGGGSDRAARLVAEALQPRLNQTVLVENVVGVGGRLAMRQFAAAGAEANTLLLVNPALMVVAPLATDLIGGHVPVAIDSFESLQAQHEAGKLRVLATSGRQRALPTVPTLAEAGTPIVAEGWNLFVARADMPADRVERLAREIAAVMATPALRDKFTAMKAVPVSMDRATSKATVDAFKVQWLPAIEKAGLKFD